MNPMSLKGTGSAGHRPSSVGFAGLCPSRTWPVSAVLLNSLPCQ